MIEVNDELSDLGCFVIFVGHNDEGRMEETFTVDNVFPVLVTNDLLDPFLAEITTQVVLIVLVGTTRDVFGLGADPSLQAEIVNILDRARTFADVEQWIFMGR